MIKNVKRAQYESEMSQIPPLYIFAIWCFSCMFEESAACLKNGSKIRKVHIYQHSNAIERG